jgi:hypothetical protein
MMGRMDMEEPVARGEAQTLPGPVVRPGRCALPPGRLATLMLSALLVVLLLSLSGCDPRLSDGKERTESPSAASSPSSASTGSSSAGSQGQALLGPYDYARVVNSDLIFKGEILSVEDVEVHSELADIGGDGRHDTVQSLLTVRVDAVYSGEVPEGRQEIVVYSQTTDAVVIGAALTLSVGKEYVFFSRDWDDGDTLGAIARYGLEGYGFPERSDVIIRHSAVNLAIAKDGYIVTDRAWGEVVLPSKPRPEPSYDESGQLSEGYRESSATWHAAWLEFTEGYAVHDPEGIGAFNCFYTEEDFAAALATLKELYPEGQDG